MGFFFERRKEKLDEKTKLKIIMGMCLWFLIFMFVILILVLTSLFTGTWNRFIDLGLYLGNVIAFGLSFYILNQGKKQKMPFLIVVGVIVFLANAWGIVRFYI